jgi:hypothetical protein
MRHKHKGKPSMPITAPGIHFITETGRVIRYPSLATDSHTYHATKGWRKNRRDTRAGSEVIGALMARAFN